MKIQSRNNCQPRNSQAIYVTVQCTEVCGATLFFRKAQNAYSGAWYLVVLMLPFDKKIKEMVLLLRINLFLKIMHGADIFLAETIVNYTVYLFSSHGVSRWIL